MNTLDFVDQTSLRDDIPAFGPEKGRHHFPAKGVEIVLHVAQHDGTPSRRGAQGSGFPKDAGKHILRNLGGDIPRGKGNASLTRCPGFPEGLQDRRKQVQNHTAEGTPFRP